MKTIIAQVRVRKQDRNGNTYHDVSLIDVDTEKQIADVVKRYGYGDQYKTTTCELIKKTLPEIAEAVKPFETDPKTLDNWRVESEVKQAGILKIIYIVNHF
ncbi:hypothetical protein [Spirosoma sordidisoli]|uniref:Uncharacterized protein n=1 Tax=Spirosoma sordidisoli TaxID=2502893 RepID=A0A4V1RWL7_9BACT|nr:hypothetical protein [Spirosoma sordidisoli]RYC70708.1 hypothetical protein EQG79_00720 [Spirosoma sordidisoli]